MIIHVVEPGESIYTISRKYGVPTQRIIADNGLTNLNRLMIGQAIVINTDVVRHTVRPGQSLYSIANIYNTTVPILLEANPSITNASLIYPGQIVLVPTSAPKLGAIYVNGYAFPNINTFTLARTMPSLSFLSIFSYNVRADGSLVPIQDNSLIEASRMARVAPIMVITNILEGESFNSDLASTILNNEQVQNTLIENIIATLQKGYMGLDIDFEYIYPRDRENYNNFVRKVTNRLRPLGYKVSTALAPKTRSDQPGLLYEAHDYAAHGETVDFVILMTYEWGYTYGQPQPVAPLNRVEEVIRYAVTQIPREKILMGIPNYGYDWTLPYVPGSSAQSLTNTGAISLAQRVGARIQYDSVAQSPFFTYYDTNGREHIVWFEDARSFEAKFNLVNKYNLGGISIWTINSFTPQLPLVLNSMYDIREVF